MNLFELKLLVDAQIAIGNGHLVVAAGDHNKMHCVYAASPAVIDNLEQGRYLEEIHPDDNEDNLPANAYVLGI
jgi:hypothetical protein